MQIKHLKTLNIKNMQWMKNKQTSTADFTFLRHENHNSYSLFQGSMVDGIAKTFYNLGERGG